MSKWEANKSNEALNNWALKEVSDATDRLDGTLKFFWGISFSSIGLFITLAKISAPSGTPSPYFWSSMICFLASLLLLLMTIIRNKPDFGEDTDLHVEHSKEIDLVKHRLKLWFFLWFLGLSFAALDLYS